VREDPHLRSLKIAVTSASHDREKIVALANLGVRTFLPKPFEQSKVTSLLRPASTTETAVEAADSHK
jgi:response regulator RpfG family c-di-GMP phosphodiesterase